MNNRINIVWLKRDVRLIDHPPLYRAAQEELPILLVYCFEPKLLEQPIYSPRHWRFVIQGLRDLYSQLRTIHPNNLQVVYGDFIDFLQTLQQEVTINAVYSSQETGIQWTFDRDKAVKKFLEEQSIPWTEISTDGLRRAVYNRDDWFPEWHRYMNAPLETPDYKALEFYALSTALQQQFDASTYTKSFQTAPPQFQKGGETLALPVLHSFIHQRFLNYARHISKPRESRKSCSRISPYLAWGHISVRFVYQKTQLLKKRASKRKSATILFDALGLAQSFYAEV